MEGDQLGEAVGLRLAHDRGPMVLDGLWMDAELAGNFLGAEVFVDQPQAVELARRLPEKRSPSPIDNVLDTALITAPGAREAAPRPAPRRRLRLAERLDGTIADVKARAFERTDLVLDLDRVGLLGPPEATRQAAEVGVDGDAGDVEGVAEHDVGGLASNPGKRDEVGHAG